MRATAVFCVRHGVGGLLVDFPARFVGDWHLSRICFPLSGPCPGCEWITLGALEFGSDDWSSVVRNRESVACAHCLVKLVATPAARPCAWPGQFQDNLLYGGDFLERAGDSGDKIGKLVRYPIPDALIEVVRALGRDPVAQRPPPAMTVSKALGDCTVLSALGADGSWHLRTLSGDSSPADVQALLSQGWRVVADLKRCPGESSVIFLQVLGRGSHVADLTLDYRNEMPAIQRVRRGKSPSNPILLKYHMAIGTQIWKEDLIVGDAFSTHFVRCVRCGENDQIILRVPPELAETELDSKAFAVVVGSSPSK